MEIIKNTKRQNKNRQRKPKMAFLNSSMRNPDPDNQNHQIRYFFKKIDKIGVFSLLKNKKNFKFVKPLKN